MTSPAGAQNKEIDCLSPEAQTLAEARLAAKRAARAEAREIRMKELERQQKEIYQVQKKYYGLDTKWGDIEQWMEDSERYSRRSRRNTSASDEDERLSVGSRGSLRTNGYDGDCYGSQSLSRRSGRVEERPDKDFTEKGSRNMPSLSAATLASLGGTSSRRGSGDTSISVDTEASIREIKELNELKDQIQDVEGKYMQGLKEMKDSLAEVEEKYKRAMVSNAQLDNEKTNFMYQVDTLKDMLLELEEQLAESQRQYEEKTKEFEREKHAHSVLQFQFAEVKEALRQREEMLEKHGIILNSEIATNGETSDTLNNVGYQGSTKMTKEELNALKSAGEGTLGKAKEVEVTNGVVEDVGKGEILPSSEQEQHKEDTVKDREVLRAGENAEDQKPAEDRAPSPGPLAGAKCEQQVQSQVHKNTSSLENPEQIGSHEVTDKPDTRTRNSLEQSCLGDLDSEEPGPTHGWGGCDASDNQDQSENSVGRQEIEKLEDPKTDLKEASSEPCPDSDPGQIPEVTRVSCADSGGTGEINTENVADGGCTAVGEQGDMVASCPLEHRDSTASHDIRCVVDGMGPSTGQSSEREHTQEVGQPEETLIQSPQAGGENTSRQDGDPEIRVEKPAQTEAQASPGAPVAQSIPQDAVGPGGTDTESASLDVKEPNQEKKHQQAETLDSPQKKTKNRKKKNKKKKAPAAAEALKDDRTDLDYQNTEAGDTEGEEQGQSTDKNRAAEPQNGEVENPRQTIPAGSSEHAKAEADGKRSEEEEEEKEEVKTQVGRATSGSVGDEEAEEHVAKGPEDGPGEAECEEGSSGSQLEKKSPPRDISSAAQIESTEEHVPATHPGQTAEEALDSGTLENDGPSGELGDFGSEGGGQARGTDEKGKSKEDCTMS